MSSLDISDDEFNIDDSEFAVLKPQSQAPPTLPPTQSASQRILAQRQQLHEQQGQSPVQPSNNYQQKIQQYQQQQEQAQYSSQQMQAQSQVHRETQEPQGEVQPAGWQPTRIDSKFDQKELNSIKGAAKQTVMGGHKTQENNRISMGGVDQTESTRLAPETLKAIRALKQGPAPEPPPKPDSGFMGKIKKLFGKE
ncbi:MAG: hypothetical protein K2W95_22165 [Candidatus Obscuribacterales bacterium]|nr:hypothetical protein [Candidatus Obscuribacterales bacterium]